MVCRLALHGGVFQNEIDLLFDAREIAVDFFQRLLAAAQVSQTLLQNGQRARLRLPQRLGIFAGSCSSFSQS